MHCPLCASRLGPSGNKDTVRLGPRPVRGASNRGTVAMPRNCDLRNPPLASHTQLNLRRARRPDKRERLASAPAPHRVQRPSRRLGAVQSRVTHARRRVIERNLDVRVGQTVLIRGDQVLAGDDAHVHATRLQTQRRRDVVRKLTLSYPLSDADAVRGRLSPRRRSRERSRD